MIIAFGPYFLFGIALLLLTNIINTFHSSVESPQSVNITMYIKVLISETIFFLFVTLLISLFFLVSSSILFLLFNLGYKHELYRSYQFKLFG